MNIKLFSVFILSCTLFSFSSFAQAPTIQWAKCYGGTNADIARCIRQTNDGGYIVVGMASSIDGEVKSSHGNNEVWVVKTNDTGKIVWSKCYGGSGNETANAVRQTSDSGYIIAGTTVSHNGDVSGIHSAQADMWILKLTKTGSLQWQRCLGGSLTDEGIDIQQTSDGGYIVAGNTQSGDGDVLANHYNSIGPSADIWIVKLDDTGGIGWQKTLGGTGDETCGAIQQTKDGGYIVAGATNSHDGDISKKPTPGGMDAWAVKLTNSGAISWQLPVGGTANDKFLAVVQSSDGKYLFTGVTASNDLDVSGNHVDSKGVCSGDLWVVNIDTAGSLVWQKCYGGYGFDGGSSIVQDKDGNIIVAGETTSVDGDVKDRHLPIKTDISDCLVLQLTNIGDIIWEKCLGGSDLDEAFSLQITSDNNCIITGGTSSADDDIKGDHIGASDYWVVKLGSPLEVSKLSASAPAIIIYPNPSQNSFTLQYHLSADANVVITDVAGRVVNELSISKNTRQATINASAWQPGSYFYKVLQGGNVLESGKLVKE